MKLAKAALPFTLAAVGAWAQVNVGEQKPEASLPFTMTTVATFELPWRLAFLPDGRMLITEKVGPLWLVSRLGEKIVVANTPRSIGRDRTGCWGSFYRRTSPPNKVSISPMSNRVTTAAAWRWPARG
jgi:aldose sugar dehydrogenase